MRQVNLAFAPEDEDRALDVIEAFSAAGVSVRPLAADRRSLTRAGAQPLVVLWSRHVTAAALPRSPAPILLARLDPSPTPGRRGVVAADLQNWRGRTDHRGWRRVLATAEATAEPAPKGQTPAIHAPAVTVAKAKSGWVVWAVVALVGLIAAAAGVFFGL